MGSSLHDAESLMNAIIGVVVAPQLWKWRRVATGAVDLYAIPQQWNPKCSGCIQPQVPQLLVDWFASHSVLVPKESTLASARANADREQKETLAAQTRRGNRF